MRRLAAFSPFLLPLALAGCMTPPDLGVRPEPLSATELDSSRSFDASSSAWPADGWWRAYADPQLDALINEALQNAPTMALAAARLRKADALLGKARASSVPSLKVDGGVSLNKPSSEVGIPVSSERRGYNDYGRIGLGLSWDLDFWGKNRALLAAATSEAEAASADAASARLLISTSVATAYADLAKAKVDRDILAVSITLREKRLALVRARVQQGMDSQSELADAEAAPAAARTELAQIDETIRLLRNRLAALVGAGPDRGLQIAMPEGSVPNAFGLPENLAAELLGRRPDLTAAKLRVDAAGHRIGVARAQFYPNINLLGLLGFEALGIGNLLSAGADNGAIGPAISLPIFDGGRRKAEFRGARADYDAAVALYDETLTQALREVADVAVSIDQLAIEIDHASTAAAASERAYALALAQYKAGASNYQSVLTIEDGLLARRRVLSSLRSRAFILDVALIKSLGGGYSSVEGSTGVRQK
ncbi:efflux transporter outer membrane subunit [Qipengyuania sp. GH25]|uniref:Efflux transporter outer membrane subunit n=1 Tax=Qipengyuania pacifica TaxID=2860199 RepID=A0ABS7JK95_9SPHN|nr:efflux transporter outer membrane subunit [Qipengyuania aerophila]MBX7489811.1 efflux transporter outer membrane subunit [Qipengyuania aerophila]